MSINVEALQTAISLSLLISILEVDMITSPECKLHEGVIIYRHQVVNTNHASSVLSMIQIQCHLIPSATM